MSYVIYSMPNCPWCDKAKQFLDDVGEEWFEVVIATPAERNRFLDEKGIEKPNRTWPRIFKNDGKNETLLGGYRELLNEFTAV